MENISKIFSGGISPLEALPLIYYKFIITQVFREPDQQIRD
jgi:hypothetical protein